LEANNKWSTPKNLGNTINTTSDEDAPFLSADEKTLFFSSNGHNTIGGYDIFKCEMDENGNWGVPVNMGTRINSPSDDIFYSQDSLAETAYFSSGRAYGMGDMDIYTASLMCKNIPHTEIRGLVVMGDDYTPVKSTITAFSLKTGDKIGTFYSDGANGKYLMVLPPDNSYYLEVAVDGMDVERPFRDTIILPRQCEYYQMFQHIQLNKVKEDNQVVAYEAVFDNAMLDIKKSSESVFGLKDVSDALISNLPIAKDSSFVMEGQVMHNSILPMTKTKIMLVNEKGEIIRKAITSDGGKFKFTMLQPDNYTVLIDEEDAKLSYYGNNVQNTVNNVLAKGHLDWKKMNGNNDMLSIEPLDSVTICFVNNQKQTIQRTLTNENGDFIIDNIKDPNLLSKTYSYNLQMTDEDMLFKVALGEEELKNDELYTIIKDLVRLRKTEQITEQIVFEPIYFDFDKFILRLESKDILEKIGAYLLNNPSASIEISGHTDWYGGDDYNMQLSQRRAKSAYDYLSNKGIAKGQMTMKWYGESRPAVANANADGTDNPENRQLNRRCEFRISTGDGGEVVFVFE
jgi:outer membrane protein OmpA-like peptidoglycan-associated protein